MRQRIVVTTRIKINTESLFKDDDMLAEYACLPGERDQVDD